ncbi:predicted protein [Histoplasma mississippiense (nom. inval.)]|nr:predicted protein [Histoplasma mississippiense (nom. inval.)]EDN02882.1 predicted protein [Histoplasma mississippiense (nom. inval.)]
MTLAVRGVVELFKLAKREQEVHQEILGFSISHDHRTVRIYGHYPIINGDKTTYYRHPILSFDITNLGVYDDWAPSHFERLCSVIDDLPNDIDFGPSPQSEVQTKPQLQPKIYGPSPTETTSLSREIGGVNLQGSSFTSLLEEEGQQVAANSRNVAPEATPRNKSGPMKRRRPTSNTSRRHKYNGQSQAE